MRVEQILLKEFDQAARAGGPSRSLLPGGRSRGEVPPPPPTFSEKELKEAEKEAYKKGFLEGTEEGKRQQMDANTETQKTLLGALSGLIQAFDPVVKSYKEQITRLRTDTPKLALSIARKAAGSALDGNAQAALEETVVRCLQSLPDSPDITLTVHDSMAEALKKHLAMLAQTYTAARHMSVHPNSEMAVSDCKISWKDGAFIRNTDSIWQHIEGAVANISAGEHYTSQKEMDALPTTSPLAEAAENNQQTALETGATVAPPDNPSKE